MIELFSLGHTRNALSFVNSSMNKGEKAVKSGVCVSLYFCTLVGTKL